MSGLEISSTSVTDAGSPGAPQEIVAQRLLLGGCVQGHGVRPALARLAIELGLRGWVANAPQGVTLHIEGTAAAVARFRARAPSALPAGAALRELDAVRAEPADEPAFRIAPSLAAGPLRVAVPVDRAICHACRDEVEGQLDRRAGYALTSCAECGPRYSLLRALPYDRAATALALFPQCPICRREYGDPSDRRFHSQINACPACGPQIELHAVGLDGTIRGFAAIQAAARLLVAGQILALRGVGGYQLLVDATSLGAVRRLRDRKGRPAKPLAVMVATLVDAESLAWLDAEERGALTDAANPIVVVRRRNDTSLAVNVAPRLDTIGLMLPATGMHALIARACGRPLVVTSGNRDGEPLVYEPLSAEKALASNADAWLHHNRDVLRPIDDSVVRVIAGRRATIRLGRGLAPLPLAVPATQHLVALGGHQKSAIALCNGGQAALGPHVGDLESEGTRARYIHHVRSLLQLYGADPVRVAHDLHPDFFTTRLAAEMGLPQCTVQHHHAHVVAGMIEPGWLDRPVLGVAWDGTGYGPDGTVWGGEFLIATAREYRRVAALRPCFLPGGMAAIHEPWRVALSLVYDAAGMDVAARLHWTAVPRRKFELVLQMIARRAQGIWTTSAGRLFDGLAALVLEVSEAAYEGQPAQLLEAVADPGSTSTPTVSVLAGAPALLDWRPVVRWVLGERALGTAPGVLASGFHRALAAGIGVVCAKYPHLPVVLTGGCFQNRLLTEFALARLAEGRPVSLPGAIPVGDGGLAAGQLAVAAARLREG